MIPLENRENNEGPGDQNTEVSGLVGEQQYGQQRGGMNAYGGGCYCMLRNVKGLMPSQLH